MEPSILFRICLFFILLGFSGLFSASETTLFSLSKIQLKRIQDRYPRRSRMIEGLLNRPRRTLTTILIGNILANVALSALASGLFFHFFGEFGIGLSIFVVTFLLLLLGEVNPKTVAIRNAESLTRLVAPFIHYFAILILPIRRMTRGITDFILDLLMGESSSGEPFISGPELRTLVSVAEKEGVLGEGEKEMIQAVLVLGEMKVKEVMTPRVDIVGCPLAASSSEVRTVLKQSHRTILPVYERSVDQIRGVLLARDFILSRQEDWRSLIRPPFFIPESKKIGELLSEFQARQESMAIVIDPYGGTSGLVTLEDVLEEVVGEIQDEYDVEEESIQRLDEKNLRVSGRVTLREVADLLKVSLEVDASQTVAEYLLSRLGRLPKVGESVTDHPLTFKVEQMTQNQIQKVVIQRKGHRP